MEELDLLRQDLEAIDEALQKADPTPISRKALERILDAASTYMAERAGNLTHQRRMERLEAIVSLLFPSYDSRRVRSGQDPRPPIHPEKNWWWNGATIDLNTLELGEAGQGASCRVESYVGGGDYDNLSLSAPPEWMSAPDDQLEAIVLAWIKAETERRDAAEKAKELAKAQWDAEEAVRRLAKLKGSA